jgi:hypothetical protein
LAGAVISGLAVWSDAGRTADLRREDVIAAAVDVVQVGLRPAARRLAPGEIGTVKQQQFDYLGRLRNANRVTNDDKRDHYWLAMQGGHVYLTPLGRYFWQLSDRKLL